MTATAPPAAPESEQWVVGSLLREPARIPDMGQLDQQDFVDPFHGAVFAALRKMSTDRVPINAATIKPKLESLKIFSGRVSPLEYLMGVDEAVPTSAHLDYHAGLVQEATRKRRLLAIVSMPP